MTTWIIVGLVACLLFALVKRLQKFTHTVELQFKDDGEQRKVEGSEPLRQLEK